MGPLDTTSVGRAPLCGSALASERGAVAALAAAPLSAAGGALAAFLWLVGRWSPARLVDGDLDASPLEQPRAAAAALLAALGLGLALLRGPPALGRPVREAWTLLVLAGAGALAWLLAAALWAPDPALAGRKALELVILAAGAGGLAAVLWRGDPAACRAGLLGAAAVGLLTLAALSLAAEDTGRRAALGGGPNVFGRNMGVLAVLGLAAWRGGLGPAWLPVAGVGAALVLLSGSRGALVATLAGVAALALLAGRGLGARAAILLAAPVAAGVAFAVDPELASAARDLIPRRVAATEAQGPLGAREAFFAEAVALVRAAPLAGVGLAGFRPLTGLVYPHNLPLEVACEAGLVGLALVAALAAAWGRALRRLRPLDPVTFSVWVVLLASAQVSGDLYDARGVVLWGLVALAPGLARAARPTPAAPVGAPPTRPASEALVGAPA